MAREFTYPIKLIKQKEGGFLIEFPDFPEAITQGENLEDSLNQAEDCLEEAIANRIVLKMDIPRPTINKKYQSYVTLPATLAAKAALYLVMRRKKISKSALAKKLGVDEKQVRRLLDPYHTSKFPHIEDALHLLGRRLEVRVSKL